MKKLYFFTSSKEDDKCGGVTIYTESVFKALTMAIKHFKAVGYKGKPRLMAI